MKGNAIVGIMMTMVGITIAVILVANLALPTAFQPYDPTTISDAEAAVFNMTNINGTSTSGYVFTTSSVDPNYAGYVVVTYQGAAATGVNITNAKATSTFCALDGTSPDTCTISAGTITDTSFGVNISSSDIGLNGVNVTGMTLYYEQKGSYSSWDSGTQAIWGMIGVALVAALLLFIFAGGKT